MRAWIVNQYPSRPGGTRHHVLARRLGLQHLVRLLGWVPHQELLGRMSRGDWDAVALPSFVEGIPVSLMEAMARGVPVIGTLAGSTVELLAGGAGILVKPGAVAELAEAIHRLATNGELRRRLAAAGRQRVVTEFNATDTARRLYEWILECGS